MIALLRVLGKPLEVLVTAPDWLGHGLPHEDTDFIRQARIDLLVPIATTPGCREAILAIGMKRSEEPYTREDQELFEAIAASLALLLEQPAAEPVHAVPTIEECPQCGTCYDSVIPASCSREGAGLVPIRLPRLLAGRYRLERRRGRGGMGTVYEAIDSSLERSVAVKVMRDELAGNPMAAERFRREALAAAGFAHPNVVTVHDFGVEAGTRAFLVMELLEGSSLREELKLLKRFEPLRTVQILSAVCSAVDAAHRRQLIHRDLKPENIFLAKDPSAEGSCETVKVLDFGVAKFLPSLEQLTTAQTATSNTGPGVLVGTIAYMSPEQLLGEGVSTGWDLWALSVVTYEMLTGALPFAQTRGGEWGRAVLAGSFTPVRQHLPLAPTRWHQFFARAFAPPLERGGPPRPATSSHSWKKLFHE